MARTKNNKTEAKTNKNFYLNLLKTAIKDKDFLDNKEIFDTLLTQSGIDIDVEFNKEENINFLSLTLNNFEKFKYLVEKHHANYHVFTSSENYYDQFTIPTHLLNKVYGNTVKFKEERKILNYLKKDETIWLDKKITRFSQSERVREESFFELYFKIYPDETKEFEKVLNFKFQDKNQEKQFDELKKDLIIKLSLDSTLSFYKHISTDDLIENIKNYIPILKKYNLIDSNHPKAPNIIDHMFHVHNRIASRTQALELLSILLDNGLYTILLIN